MTLKHYFVFALLLSLVRPAGAQDSTGKKIREFYLSTNSFSQLNVQIQYKQQLKKNRFLKLSLLQLAYSQSDNSALGLANINTNYSGALQLGLEFRSSLYNDFAFYHGPNLGFSSSVSVHRQSTVTTPERTTINENYNAYFAYTLGLLFHLRNHFYLSAELNPALTTNLSPGRFLSTITIAGSNYGAMVSVAYRL